MIWLALVLAFAIYWHTLRGQFVFDDNPGIRDNRTITEGLYRDIRWWHWRSLTHWSFALQSAYIHKTGKVDSVTEVYFAFHAFNVIVHALAGFVAGQVVGWQESGLALPAMMLWIAMPAAVNAVAYMSSRGTLMAGLFSLAALWAVLSGWSVLALPLTIAAILAKEDHMAWPFALSAAAWTANQPYWAEAFAVLPVAAGIFFRKQLKELLHTAHSPKLAGIGLPDPFPGRSRSAIAVELILRFPQWAAGYGYCIARQFKAPGLARISAAFGIAAAAIAAAVWFPDVRLPLCLILASPLPLYAILIQVRDPIQDYRNYSAMIGPLMLAVPLLPSWGVVLILLAWAIASAYRAFDWRNPASLWTGAIRDGAGALAWNNLGAAYHAQGNFTEALRCYQACLRLHPSTGSALLNLALLEGQQGKTDAALIQMEECTRRFPTYLNAWRILGNLYGALQDGPNAQRCQKRIEELTAA